MLKRKNGRILLALLVVTGLAGTLHDSSLTMKERKFAITHLKLSRDRLLSSVQGLTPAQLRYHPNKNDRSIQEYLLLLAANEVNVQAELKNGMEKAPNSYQRTLLNYNDEQITNLRDLSLLPQPGSPGMSFNRTVDALISFQSKRQACVRYIRTSTEDLRDHVFDTHAGWLDAYQYVLSLAAGTYTLADKIEEIRKLPSFPGNN